jgi:hypothetical protein
MRQSYKDMVLFTITWYIRLYCPTLFDIPFTTIYAALCISSLFFRTLGLHITLHRNHYCYRQYSTQRGLPSSTALFIPRSIPAAIHNAALHTQVMHTNHCPTPRRCTNNAAVPSAPASTRRSNKFYSNNTLIPSLVFFIICKQPPQCSLPYQDTVPLTASPPSSQKMIPSRPR